MKEDFKPYIPADTSERELTIRAALLGILIAIVLGAANAYVGLKAGITISAMFPAAVIAIAAFRLPFMRGGLLEQNITRTAASVGEALVVGAIFTIPAFVIIQFEGEPLWSSFNYWETTFIILAGGLLGILLVIVLRRPICVEMDLPFPESVACFEIVKSGQKGASGAKFVFGAMGLGALIQIFKADRGILLIKESLSGFWHFPKSVLSHAKFGGAEIAHTGGMPFASPAASPALLGIGYVIGFRLAMLNFSGSLFAWSVLIPLILFMDPSLGGATSQGLDLGVAVVVWKDIVRPIAVGAMLMATVYTLIKMRKVIWDSIKGALKATGFKMEGTGQSRLDLDLPLRWVLVGIVFLVIPITGIYWYFTGDLFSALVAAAVMVVASFLLSAIGGYLAGLIGLSNQPLSGLTLTALILAAVLMVALGHTGKEGMIVVLSVTALVCVALGTSGDMLQDLKVGHLVGATPWKMELVEIVSILLVSFVMVVPIMLLHNYGGGIGSEALPAPQAGLMAQLISGIVGGSMAWGLLLIGVMFGLALIFIGAPSPMLIAVGMYLPLDTTFAIFIGGCLKYGFDRLSEKKKLSASEKEASDGKGILVASGFISGEAICGILLAGWAMAAETLGWAPSILQMLTGKEELGLFHSAGGWMSLLVFGVVAYSLIRLPLKKA